MAYIQVTSRKQGPKVLSGVSLAAYEQFKSIQQVSFCIFKLNCTLQFTAFQAWPFSHRPVITMCYTGDNALNHEKASQQANDYQYTQWAGSCQKDLCVQDRGTFIDSPSNGRLPTLSSCSGGISDFSGR